MSLPVSVNDDRLIILGSVKNVKETVKTSRSAGYLEKIFRVLNREYFEDSLEEPIITIQSTPRAYGHVTVGKAWRKANGDQRHELNIGAGTLDRPIECVVATMMHEMVHLHCMQEGIKDTSRGGAYHNRRFRDIATSKDLDISYDARIGWSITEPTEKLLDFVIAQGWQDVHMGREEGWQPASGGSSGGSRSGGSAPVIPPKGSNSRKLICPCCRQSVRATKAGLNIICGNCMERMIEEQ